MLLKLTFCSIYYCYVQWIPMYRNGKWKNYIVYIHGTVFSSVGVCLLLFSGSTHSPLWQVAWLLSQLHLLTTLEGSSIKSRAQLSKGRKFFSRAWSVSCPALPCPALPCPALPCPALPCPALPSPVLSSPVQFSSVVEAVVHLLEPYG